LAEMILPGAGAIFTRSLCAKVGFLQFFYDCASILCACQLHKEALYESPISSTTDIHTPVGGSWLAKTAGDSKIIQCFVRRRSSLGERISNSSGYLPARLHNIPARLAIRL